MDHVELFERHRKLAHDWIPVSVRKGMLKALWNAILHHEQRLIDALARDLAKPTAEVHLNEIYPMKSEIRQATRHISGWTAPMPTPTPLAMTGTKSFIQHEPKGQVLIISPWNFPVILTLRPLVSAIAAGNRCIVKPSEHTPHTAEVLASIVSEALPQEVAAVVQGGPDVSAALTRLPFQHICFTGGTEIGKKVMASAAKNLASVTLELGGKSPVIVEGSAHVADASKRIAWGKCLNNGQACIAPDYMLVHATIQEDMLKALSSRIDEMYRGNALESPERSVMVNEHHWRRVVGLIEDAIAQGARVVCGGTWDEKTRRIAPTILANCSLDMAIMKEEIFGPVLPVIAWTTREELLALLAAHPHPLALYVFSKNKAFTDDIMANTKAGTTGINEVFLQVAQPALPFGGIQSSGMGRTGGFYGFQQFSNIRSVVQQRTRWNILPLTFPPFGKRGVQLARAVQRWL